MQVTKLAQSPTLIELVSKKGRGSSGFVRFVGFVSFGKRMIEQRKSEVMMAEDRLIEL